MRFPLQQPATFIAIQCVLALSLSAFCFAQNSPQQKGIKQKIKDKVVGDKNNEEKAMQEYAKLLESAQRKYNDPNNLDFRIAVNEIYRQKRREHSDIAFQINTIGPREQVLTFSGEKVSIDDSVYDNELVQDYVNRVGQSIVPTNSPHRYAFRVLLDPVPEARAYSTGTIYVTTGLLSLVDNEAQLAYLLAHEITHIEKNHWLQDAMVLVESEERRQRAEKTAKLVGLATAITLGLFAGVKSDSALGGAYAGVLSGWLANLGTSAVLKFLQYRKTFDWERLQDDECDREGIKLMFDRNYDPREVPKFYTRLRALTEKEPRLSDGFIANSKRIKDRGEFASNVFGAFVIKSDMSRGASNLRRLRKDDATDSWNISPLEAGKTFASETEAEKREKSATHHLGAMDEVLRLKLEKNEIIASTAEFESVMADLKRDNGIRAFFYDMYSVALENLREARELRSNDPYTHYYYGKVLLLTARSRAERAEALDSFVKAINEDNRGVLAEPWLHRALAHFGDKNPRQYPEIIGYLKKYVDIYQQEHGGRLPSNMDTIYAYLKDLGESRWVSRPATNISTKNLEPIEIANQKVTPTVAETVSPEVKTIIPETAPLPVTKEAKKETKVDIPGIKPRLPATTTPNGTTRTRRSSPKPQP